MRMRFVALVETGGVIRVKLAEAQMRVRAYDELFIEFHRNAPVAPWLSFHLADDFLDDVFDGKNADMFALGADHDADWAAAGAQGGQDAIDAFRGEHKLRLLHEQARGLVIAARVLEENLVHVDNANNFVAFHDRE